MNALRLQLNGETMFQAGVPKKGYVTASVLWLDVEPDGQISIVLHGSASSPKGNMLWDTPKISVGDTISFALVDVPESELAEPSTRGRLADLKSGGNLPNPLAMADDGPDPVRSAISKLKSKLLEREADLVVRQEHLAELHDELTAQAKSLDQLPADAVAERNAFDEGLKDLDRKIEEEALVVADLDRRVNQVRIAGYRLESIHEKLRDRAKWMEIYGLVRTISDLDKHLLLLEARHQVGRDALTWDELLTLSQQIPQRLDTDPTR